MKLSGGLQSEPAGGSGFWHFRALMAVQDCKVPLSYCGWRAGRTPESPQSFVAARVSSFQVPACFCQFIRMCRLVELFLPSATASLSPIQ